MLISCQLSKTFHEILPCVRNRWSGVLAFNIHMHWISFMHARSEVNRYVDMFVFQCKDATKIFWYEKWSSGVDPYDWCRCIDPVFVRRAGLLWSQRDFEWRWSVPLFKCLTVLEFSFILFDLCLLITFFNFIMNYVPIVTFWIFTYHKIWILSIMFCSIWSYWIIYFLACLEVSWRVVS